MIRLKKKPEPPAYNLLVELALDNLVLSAAINRKVRRLLKLLEAGSADAAKIKAISDSLAAQKAEIEAAVARNTPQA